MGLTLWKGAAAIFFISLYWTIISEIIIGKGHVLGGILFLIFITAVSLGALLMAYSSSLEKRSSHPQSDQPKVAPKGDTAPEVLPAIPPELMMTVTEQTTHLLEKDDAQVIEQSRDRELEA